jgi:methylmalonyl-CoA/ethylmalonyl-CoA epimerase
METSFFSGFHHIALVVKNLDQAIAYYQDLGIGPFISPPVKAVKQTWMGKVVPVDFFKRREVMGKMGESMLQLCQPLGGESPWQTFLDTRGEGVHHIGCIVDNVEKEEIILTEKGIEIILSTRFEGGGGSCYADISKIGGILIELIQRPKGIID